jgi:hypothetical protein
LPRKPEFKWVEKMRARKPELLLNDTFEGKPSDAGAAADEHVPMRHRGSAPRTQLSKKFDYRGQRSAMDPTPLKPHRWPVDPRNLSVGGTVTTDRPFAEYLLFALRYSGSKNPSPAAIQHLYLFWRKYQPEGAIHQWPVPSTINDALRVPY